jgi:hypothetical protein
VVFVETSWCEPESDWPSILAVLEIWYAIAPGA